MARYKEEKFNDLGLGSRPSAGRVRSLNKNGTFNFKRTGIPFLERVDFFHSLITMSWIKFFGIIFLGYILANLFFAGIYVLIGVEHLTGIEGNSKFDHFVEAFFFSSQTITTLGYGRVAPVGIQASTIAAIESMLGLLAFALATGLLYGRFSSPRANIQFSQHAVVAPFHEINGFMFRLINLKHSQLIEVEVTLTLSMQKTNSETREFFTLDLERKKVIFFPASWTIVHPITDSSPLYRLTNDDFYNRDVEFIVLLKAFDESFSQTVYSRSSYKAHEINWGEKFVYLINQEKGHLTVDVRRIDETEKAELNKE
ncbi:MAG: K+ channel, inward rectifier [Saprospiraceae bacterium]|nr:K+ channel, inward rectifier [Saprospiraceae bacterium]MBK7523136.1 K+ channel, inward rectifier [Saprospiraceae bacterium]MBK8079233.1 K+ channel, inward rectifier [Saprospiraceae bacterium]MBK8370795.1 K+ channel, inward rectifier [Saprospiraceae bacterium]MBK8820293.1 K+ channel, inward rectifier [Saprospiraceae bacterium]